MPLHLLPGLSNVLKQLQKELPLDEVKFSVAPNPEDDGYEKIGDIELWLKRSVDDDHTRSMI